MNIRDISVALVGAPRSGNRLIQRMLQRHGLVAEVRHYGMLKAFRNGGSVPHVAVWPVRDRASWTRSCMRDWSLLPKPEGVNLPSEPDVEELDRIHNYWTLRFVTSPFAIPVLPVSYERLVEKPESLGRRILSFAVAPASQVKWRGWGEEIFDGNAKWTTSQQGQQS